jgi:hypothetical protein
MAADSQAALIAEADAAMVCDVLQYPDIRALSIDDAQKRLLYRVAYLSGREAGMRSALAMWKGTVKR